MSASRSPRPPDTPERRALRAVRTSLFRLHKTLIDSERRALERARGSISGGEFLQVLIHDPAFEWLQPFTGIIVETDEALAAPRGLDRAHARALLDRILELVEPADRGLAEHYAEIRQRDPEVLVAHVELTANIRAALE